MIGIDWPNRDERHAMNLIRKSAWAVVMVGAVAGCTSDEPSTNPGTPTTNLPKAPAKPVVPAPAEAAKEGAAKDMQPAAPKVGDTKKPDESPKLEPPKSEPKADTKTGAAAAKLTAEEIAEIKKLPAAEQDLALKQAICPVSDHHLGSMEKPIKVTAEGRTFFLCCEGCEPDLKKDPKAVIAKLDAKAAK
jgi:YHS domain-containing protein